VVRNIDPNTFRTELEEFLTEQSGYRTELGEIKLQWRPQPQFRVDGLKFYQPQTFEKLLQADQVRIDVDPISIWRKRFNMPQIVIQSPEIFLGRIGKGYGIGSGWSSTNL